MALTNAQLTVLRHDLTRLGDIKYEHLRDELLDHYAALTEARMAEGQSFDWASLQAWQSLGEGKGVQRIQDDYEDVTRKQVKARHKAILRSYLKWPTVVTTLLVAVLFTYLMLVLPPKPMRILAVLLTISPGFVLLSAAYPYYRHKDSRKKLILEYINSYGNVGTLLGNLVSFSGVIRGEDASQFGMSCLVLIAAVSLCLSISLAQLTREQFYYKLAR